MAYTVMANRNLLRAATLSRVLLGALACLMMRLRVERLSIMNVGRSSWYVYRLAHRHVYRRVHAHVYGHVHRHVCRDAPRHVFVTWASTSVMQSIAFSRVLHCTRTYRISRPATDGRSLSSRVQSTEKSNGPDLHVYRHVFTNVHRHVYRQRFRHGQTCVCGHVHRHI